MSRKIPQDFSKIRGEAIGSTVALGDSQKTGRATTATARLAATQSLTIKIPMDPPRACSPNYRQHWRGRHAATKAFRTAAFWAAAKEVWNLIELIDDPSWFVGPVAVTARIGWSKGRKTMDPTNAAGSLKPAIDGLQDCLIFKDDKQVVSLSVTQERDKEGRGYVVLEVQPMEEN